MKNLFSAIMGVVLLAVISISFSCSGWNQATSDERILYDSANQIMTGKSSNPEAKYTEKEAFNNVMNNETITMIKTDNQKNSSTVSQKTEEETKGLDKDLYSVGLLGLVDNPSFYGKLTVKITNVSNGMKKSVILDPKKSQVIKLMPGDYEVEYFQGVNYWKDDKPYTVAITNSTTRNVDGKVNTFYFVFKGWD